MTILFAWLLADFISGMFHWWEDRVLSSSSSNRFLESLIRENERHHTVPTYMLKHSWWGNIRTSAPIAWSLALLLLVYGAPAVIWLAFFFVGFGNLIHRWAHEPESRRPVLVTLLQRTGFFISPRAHSLHHISNKRLVLRDETEVGFCAMSGWLNPVLDRIHFFKFLNQIFGNREVKNEGL